MRTQPTYEFARQVAPDPRFDMEGWLPGFQPGACPTCGGALQRYGEDIRTAKWKCLACGRFEQPPDAVPVLQREVRPRPAGTRETGHHKRGAY